MPTHLIVGPANHGVTAYALSLAEAVGDEEIVRETELTDTELPPGPVHVTFTDHLFGPDPDSAVDHLLKRTGTRALSVSFHDVPQPEEGAQRFQHRARAYRRLAAHAWVSVVNSQHEADFFGAPHTPHVIPLPIPTVHSTYAPEPHTVGILGYLYPGKGHEDVIEQLAGSEYRLRFLGQVSAGHEQWAQALCARAEELGVEVEITGWLDDEELAREMGRIEIPVCAHRHFSASGSLMTWLGAGRHVLVSDSAYAREIATHYDEQITLVPRDHWREAIDNAAPTPPVAPRPHGWPEVARMWQRLWYPPVSVVIPHYNDHEVLARTVKSVRAQDYPGPVEIVVADDGSPTPPAIEDAIVVTQPDEGFRAAAARNQGAAAASGDILAFVDADTILEPDYLRQVTSCLAGRPRGVVVGTRTTGPDRTEPEWLRRAWADTDDLARADDTSWRFIISAVLTCHRAFFTDLGGFDATLVGYGGEDWDFGYRAWNAGATFIHSPHARAHHPQPDWGARHDDPLAAAAEKNAESIALATRITHPIARPAGVIFERTDIVVRLRGKWGPGVSEAVIASWLSLGDVAVVVDKPPQLFAQDPRVRTQADPARIEVALERALAPTDALLQALRRHGHVTAPGLVASTARARALHTQATAVDGVCTPVEGPIRLERLFAGW